MVIASAVSVLVAFTFPLGLEINLSKFPRPFENASAFTMQFRAVAADGTVLDGGPIWLAAKSGPRNVCALLFASARAQGWSVSRLGIRDGDDLFVLYGTTAGSPVQTVQFRSPYPVGVRAVPKQPGRRD